MTKKFKCKFHPFARAKRALSVSRNDEEIQVQIPSIYQPSLNFSSSLPRYPSSVINSSASLPRYPSSVITSPPKGFSGESSTMDSEFAHIQPLSMFGISKKGCMLIYESKKIFTQIILAFILPLSIMILLEVLLSDVLFGILNTGEHTVFEVISQRPRENGSRPFFWMFQVVYVIFIQSFTLLSISAVHYTVASKYTAKPMTFKKVVSVVPKVWKRLFVTLLCNIAIMLVYHILAVIALLVWATTIAQVEDQIIELIVFVILIILYLSGFVYLNEIWQLACVVSVLETVYGFKAMKKSRRLIKGKLFAGSVIFVVTCFPVIVVERLFQSYVVHGDELAMVSRVVIGIASFLVVLFLIVYGLVLQTVIYFECKSLHNEMIDKAELSNHLEKYVGHYRERGEVQVAEKV